MASAYNEHRARREQWAPQATAVFGEQSRAVLDILELTDWAWRAVYRDECPSQRIVDCIFVWADQIRAADKAEDAD
jgi:hypothetical protein